MNHNFRSIIIISSLLIVSNYSRAELLNPQNTKFALAQLFRAQYEASPQIQSLINNIKNLSDEYNQLLEKCRQDKVQADNSCWEDKDKGLNDAKSMIGSLVTQFGASMAGECGKFANAMKLAQGAQLEA